MEVRVTRRSIALVKADQIDRENQQKGHSISTLPYSKKRTRWVPGYCKICREAYGFITHEHAKKHGFASPNEMAKSDIVCLQWEQKKGTQNDRLE